MTARTIQIESPSRLHFGMLSFGHGRPQLGPEPREFGGVGVMISRPALKLSISPATRLQATGPRAERALEFAQRVARHLGLEEEPRVSIRVHRAPPEHVGLGTGTQLGMSVAAGLYALFRGGLPIDATLAASAGRGLRSAVGLYGFARGGMIVEAGKSAIDRVAPLVAHVRLPRAWRFVLIRPAAEQGLAGEAERRAFASLEPVAEETTDRLCRELLMHLLPAAQGGNFDAFSESLYRFGYLAGTCFAAEQGSAFATPRLVALLRSWGVRGVGQSSWGPTIFALVRHQAAAGQLVDWLREQKDGRALRLAITRVADSARMKTVERSTT